MKGKGLLRRLSLLLAIGLLAAACGGGEADQAETEDASGADTTTEEPTETAPTDGAMTEPEPTDAGPTAAVNTGDGTLAVGSVLPQTGSLAFLGPPEFAGVGLAVQDINEAGGVLGNDVTLSQGDSGDTTTDIANQTVDRLLAEGADVIVGAASSAVSFTIIDKITGAGVVEFSPANTSADFSTYADNGLYFRTAPSDVLQGRILGQLVLQDGAATVGIMALQDAYGEGLANQAEATITESGGEVTNKIIYDPQAQNFDAEIQQLIDSDPDAIIVIGFDETSRILSTMIEQGIGPGEKAVYGSDGNMGNALAEAMSGASIAGMRGTLPGSVASDEFRERLLEYDPELIDYSYAGESYDAVVVPALAAIAADSDEPTVFAEQIPAVTKDGTACTTFAECKELLEAGEDIDYDGQSGPIELNDAGDPTEALFQILEFNEDNELELADTQQAALDPDQ
jgi:branched-chain amino acid transport system substrate-binding protein